MFVSNLKDFKLVETTRPMDTHVAYTSKVEKEKKEINEVSLEVTF